MRADAKAASTAAKAVEMSTTATKSIIPEASLTIAVLQRKVKEIAASRGRRGTDNRQVLRELEALSRLSLKFGSPRVEIPIVMHVITAQFDLQRTLDDYMDTKNWKSCAVYLERIASVLDDGYTLGVEHVEEGDLIIQNVGTAGKKMKAAAKASEGAMAAVAADEKLINPHTVRDNVFQHLFGNLRNDSNTLHHTNYRVSKRHRMNAPNASVRRRKPK
jgi:hypothetical protein